MTLKRNGELSLEICFVSSKYLGDFHLYENEDGDTIACNEAAVFIGNKGKLYVYRSKDGDWVVGR